MLSFSQSYTESPKRFISTSTPRKLEVINRENTFIKKFIPSRGPKEQIVGVVGDAKTGLERHLLQYLELDFFLENTYIFEILLSEYKNLYYHNKANFENTATIIYGDIFYPKMSRVYNLNTKLVTHADVDITTALPADLNGEVNKIFTTYPNLKSAVFVYSTRNTQIRSSAAQKYIENPIIKKFIDFVKINKGDSYSTALKNAVELYFVGATSKELLLKKLFKSYPNYSFLVQSYQGKGPMISITMVQSKKQEIDSNVVSFSESDFYRVQKIVRDFQKFTSYSNYSLYTFLQTNHEISFTREEHKKIGELLKNLYKTAEKYSK